MSDSRPPMGYGAHQQQFDTAAPWAPAPVSPGPGTPESYPPGSFPAPAPDFIRAIGVAAVPLRTVNPVPTEIHDVLAPEIYAVNAPTERFSSAATPEPPAFVARIPTSIPVRRPRRTRRWAQLAVATTVAACALAAVGVGYVAFHHTAETTPLAQVPLLPGVPSTESTVPGQGAVPGASPTSASPTTSGPATSIAPTTAGATVTATVLPPGGQPPSPPSGSPAAPALSPAATQAPDTSTPVVILTPPAPLPPSFISARLSYSSSSRTGTISITNSSGVDVDNWTVTLTIPGGNRVTPRGAVSVSQSGERVEFNPTSGSVDSGETFTFSFTIRGTPDGAPEDCAINGRPCG